MHERPHRRARGAPLDHEPGAVTWWRQQAGMTKTQLAKAAGVSLSLISDVERGTRNAGPWLIDVMAEILNCPPGELKRKGDRQQPATRMAVVCAECEGLWEPGHECPLPREANGAAA
jgi:transcriptional regulator with XRE-family HTH domain